MQLLAKKEQKIIKQHGKLVVCDSALFFFFLLNKNNVSIIQYLHKLRKIH